MCTQGLECVPYVMLDGDSRCSDYIQAAFMGTSPGKYVSYPEDSLCIWDSENLNFY